MSISSTSSELSSDTTTSKNVLYSTSDSSSSEIVDNSNVSRGLSLPPSDRKIKHRMMKLFPLASMDDVKKNEIWMTHRDVKKLFSAHHCNRSKYPNYVRIANQVYRVSCKSGIPRGWVGVNPLQRDDIREAIFEDHGTENVMVSNFELLHSKKHEVTELKLLLRPYENDTVALVDELIIERVDLQKRLQKLFRKEVITNGQSLIVDFPQGSVEAIVKKVVTRGSEEGERHRFGLITSGTEMHFKTKSMDELTIVDRIYKDEVKSIKFELSIEAREEGVKSKTLPLILDASTLLDEILHQLNGEVIQNHYTHIIEHASGWNIHVAFGKADIDEEMAVHNTFSDYGHGYRVSDKEKIQLETSKSEIILRTHDTFKANLMHFKVTDFSPSLPGRAFDRSKGIYVNIKELEEELRKLRHEFVEDQCVAIQLSTGLVYVDLFYVNGNYDFPVSKEGYRPSYTLEKETQLQVSQLSSVRVALVDDEERRPLKKLTIEVAPDSYIGSHLILTHDELKEALNKDKPTDLYEKSQFMIDIVDKRKVKVEVKKMEFAEELPNHVQNGSLGVFTEETEIEFISNHAKVALEEKVDTRIEIPDPIKRLEELGLGGLDDQIKKIIRSVFLSRGRLKGEFGRRGMKPVRGVLLCGPPGTGKTTLARHLSHMLGCVGDRLQMLSATEIFNMWVGESERNVRELFEPARKAQIKHGEDSPLYVVVVDEIDAMLPARSGGGSGEWRDSIVNQFLGELDGLKQLNNILVIGMTNRIDQIDPAALRSGRFGVHVEIGIPDDKGRRKILEIHTKKLRTEDLLAKDVSLDELVKMTPNFTGADIEGMVQMASSYSLERLNKLDDDVDVKDHSDGKVTMQDFEKALGERRKKDEIPDSVKQMFL